MRDDVMVNAADIARIADVGRAAVSNWRKRFDDFPRPVGGTASSPSFSLAEIEQWLRKHNRHVEVAPLERVWQRLRAVGDDLRLGDVVVYTGAFLLYLQRDPAAWRELARLTDDEMLSRLPGSVAAVVPEPPGELPHELGVDPSLIRAIAEVGAEEGPAATFDAICARYIDVHARRLLATPEPVGALMARLAATAGKTVLDPSCGIGTLLLASGAARALGQDVNGTAARLTAVRLLLHGVEAAVRDGDSLRADAFPDELVDAVVCNPPFNDRGWGYEELTSDPRWEYGLPPRGESELAWVQHCLSHVRPGGLVVIMMPGVAASRRSGRRVRGNLLRAGALRAIVTLSAGAAPASSGAPDLWVLRRPEAGDPPASDVLMVNAGDDFAVVEGAWQAYTSRTETGPPELPEASRVVRIIDLLDEEVALTPAHRVSRQTRAEPFTGVRERAREAISRLEVPKLTPLPVRRELPLTSIGELSRAGVVSIGQGPLKLAEETGDLPVLTVKDLVRGRAPSGRTCDEPGLVFTREGDVVAPLIPGENTAARVVAGPPVVLGPRLLLFRVDPDRLDPYYLAGCLRVTGETSVRLGSSVRMDPRRARLPRLPIEEQREYGEAFRRLLAYEDAVRELRTVSDDLLRIGFEGLLDGTLHPE
ncbi:class I SAM-dependent DNA methyltransferase [Sphaerimonospora cavernae]|uniref:Class I SAM-dependent DNA methyltransferase n=1 Tax=Sphaerimonospora cavernae TaxID=1740611 RepID=A0ABV6U8X1_9ACTN